MNEEDCNKPSEDDALIDNLIANNPKFRAVLERANAAPRTPYDFDEAED